MVGNPRYVADLSSVEVQAAIITIDGFHPKVG
jgi:hypothetical protein